MAGQQHSDAVRPKRDAAATRERILKAATRCFAGKGYGATGIREIATEAGVSLPLLSRYFGSKAGLLQAALETALTPQPFLDGPRAEFGERLTKLIVTASPAQLPLVTAMLAAGEPEARLVAQDIVDRQIVAPLAQWLGGADAHRRALAITMLGSGLTTHLHILPLSGTNTVAADDPLVTHFALAMQRLVDGDLCGLP